MIEYAELTLSKHQKDTTITTTTHPFFSFWDSECCALLSSSFCHIIWIYMICFVMASSLMNKTKTVSINHFGHIQILIGKTTSRCQKNKKKPWAFSPSPLQKQLLPPPSFTSFDLVTPVHSQKSHMCRLNKSHMFCFLPHLNQQQQINTAVVGRSSCTSW